MKNKIYFATIILFIAGLALTGCTGIKTVTGEARTQIAAYADPMVDSILTAIDKTDYATFSKDFDPTMKKAMVLSSFETMAQKFQNKLGNYQSKELSQIQDANKYYAVIYTLKYAKGSPVTFRLVLTKTEPHQVSGLWYNSPDLK